MMLFLAGCFPLLNDINKEREFMNKILSKGREYNRLASFYYPKTCDTILSLKKEKEDADRKNTSRLRGCKK